MKASALIGSQKSIVKMLDFYRSKVPNEPKVFYLRTLQWIPKDPMKEAIVFKCTGWYQNFARYYVQDE